MWNHVLQQRTTIVMLASAAFAFQGDRLEGQPSRKISSRPSCSDCRVQKVQVTTLGSETDGGFVGLPTGIERFNDMWVVTHLSKPRSVSFFSSSGAFVRDIGRAGSGPGEFRNATRLLVNRDSLFVYDQSLDRMQVYSRDLQPQRMFKIDVPVYRIHALKDGRFVVEGYPLTKERIGYPLHLVNRDGLVEKSFGAVVPKRDPKEPRAYMRVSALGPDGTIWTARMTEYLIEQWDINGNKLSELRGEVPWFKTDHGRAVVSPTEPPKTRVAGLWFDDESRLWIAMSVADANWKDGVVQSEAGRYNAFRVEDENRFYDTIIDVIDIRTGSLIARARMDEWFSPASQRGFVITAGERPDGSPTIGVWRPQLIQPER